MNQHKVTLQKKKSELEEFIEYARIVMGVLGHKVFEPLIAIESNADDNSQKESASSIGTVFYIKKSGANARAVQTTDGFIVLSGSVIRKDTVPSCPDSALSAREKYKGIIDEHMTLIKDVPFKTPSGAANFVLGRSANGNIEWATEQGVTFGKFESEAT